MAVAESKVSTIIGALSDLESSIDSLDATISDMKRQMVTAVQRETDKLYEETRSMAIKEAEKIVEKAKKSANKKAEKITKESEESLEKLRQDIDSGFQEAVDVAVDAIMKP